MVYGNELMVHPITVTTSVSRSVLPPQGADTITLYVPGTLHVAVTVAPVAVEGVAPVSVQLYVPEGTPEAVKVVGLPTIAVAGPLMTMLGVLLLERMARIIQAPSSSPPLAVYRSYQFAPLSTVSRLLFVSLCRLHIAAG